jgi:hypothetical protein
LPLASYALADNYGSENGFLDIIYRQRVDIDMDGAASEND